MTVLKARVRRDGQLAEVPAGQLVTGDIVSIKAGDVVPADGRLVKAATLEADAAVAFAIAAIPVGLPTVVTTILAYGTEQLARPTRS